MMKQVLDHVASKNRDTGGENSYSKEISMEGDEYRRAIL